MTVQQFEYSSPAPTASLWAGTANELAQADVSFPKQRFATLLMTDGGFEQIEPLIERFLLAGCRYVVCWGASCEAVHDFVDEVSVVMQLDGRLDTEDLVMTTWHEDKSLADVVWYARHCAMTSDDIESTTLLCLLVNCSEHISPLDLLLQEPA